MHPTPASPRLRRALTPVPLGALAVVAALLTPLIVDRSAIFPFVVPRTEYFRLVLGAGLAAGLALGVTRGYRLRDRGDPILLAWAVFLLVGIAAAVLGVAPLRSLYGEMERMWGVTAWFYLLVWYVLLRWLPTRDLWDVVLWAVVTVGAAVAVVAVLQQVGPPLGVRLPGSGGRRAYGTLGNASYLGIYSLLTVSAGLLLSHRCRLPAARRYLGAVIAISLVAFTLSGARAALIGLVIGAVAGAALLVHWSTPRGRAPIKRLRALIGIAVLVPIGVLATGRSNPMVRRMADLSVTDSNVTTRFEAWGVAYRQFRAEPLLGIGTENFPIAVSRDDRRHSEAFERSTWDRAHNVYLDVLVGSGIFGLLAYCAIWAAYFRTVLRARRSGGASDAEAAVLSGAGIAYLVYSAAWFEDLSSALVLVVLFAYGRYLRTGEPLFTIGVGRGPKPGRLAVAALGVAVIALFTYQRAYAVAEAARRVGHALRATDVESRVERYESALTIAGPEGMAVTGAFVDYLRSFATSVDRVRDNPEHSALLWTAISRGLREVDAAIRMDPLNGVWWVDQSRLLLLAAELRGDRRFHDGAIESLHRAIELDPYRVSSYHLLADLHLGVGRSAEAAAVLRRARRIDETSGATRYRLSQAYAIGGDLERSRQELRAALSLGHVPSTDVVVWHLNRLESSGGRSDADRLLAAYGDVRLDGRGRRRPRPLRKEEFALLSRRPLLHLREGREDEAIESARRLSRSYPPASGLIERFNADVASGWGTAWAAHPDLGSAARVFGGLAELDRLRR